MSGRVATRTLICKSMVRFDQRQRGTIPYFLLPRCTLYHLAIMVGRAERKDSHTAKSSPQQPTWHDLTRESREQSPISHSQGVCYTTWPSQQWQRKDRTVTQPHYHHNNQTDMMWPEIAGSDPLSPIPKVNSKTLGHHSSERGRIGQSHTHIITTTTKFIWCD